MYVKKPKKKCPYNEGVECEDDECECCGWNPDGRTRHRHLKQCPHNAGVECEGQDCECCGWNPAGRTKKRERKKRTYTRHQGPKIKEPGTKGPRKMQTNNASGCTGVYWNGRRQKWSAEIRIEGKKKYLGSFENLEDAIKARKEAETRLLAENN